MAIICTAAFRPLSQTGTPWFSSQMPRNGMVRPNVTVTVMVAAMHAIRPRRRCLGVMRPPCAVPRACRPGEQGKCPGKGLTAVMTPKAVRRRQTKVMNAEGACSGSSSRSRRLRRRSARGRLCLLQAGRWPGLPGGDATRSASTMSEHRMQWNDSVADRPDHRGGEDGDRTTAGVERGARLLQHIHPLRCGLHGLRRQKDPSLPDQDHGCRTLHLGSDPRQSVATRSGGRRQGEPGRLPGRSLRLLRSTLG